MSLDLLHIVDHIDRPIAERMARAAWDFQATVPWDEFFVGANAEKKTFYVDGMLAALNQYRTWRLDVGLE